MESEKTTRNQQSAAQPQHLKHAVTNERVGEEFQESERDGCDAEQPSIIEISLGGLGGRMSQINSKFHLNKILQIASELKYQLPLTETEFEERGCGCCGARARFPGPCADCAELELARLVGSELARSWADACREEQRIWQSFSYTAAYTIGENAGLAGATGNDPLACPSDPIRKPLGA